MVCVRGNGSFDLVMLGNSAWMYLSVTLAANLISIGHPSMIQKAADEYFHSHIFKKKN